MPKPYVGRHRFRPGVWFHSGTVFGGMVMGGRTARNAQRRHMPVHLFNPTSGFPYPRGRRFFGSR